MDAARDRESIFRLAIDDRVSACDDAARFGHLVDRPLEDSLQLRERCVLRPGGDVQTEEHLATHRVHIRHRVRCADRARGIGVVDDRRKEVKRLDDRDIRRDEIDGGVVGDIEADEELRGTSLRAHRTQDLRQRAGAQLRPSAGAGGQRRQSNLIAGEHEAMLLAERGRFLRRGDGQLTLMTTLARALPLPTAPGL